MTAKAFEDKVKDAAGEMGAFVGEAADRARAQAVDIGEQAYVRGKRVARSVASQAQEQSGAAMLIAGAVGVAIGYLLARR